MACASSKTGAADGLCRGISAGTDPDNECDQSAASTCGLDGTCDGAGACRKYVTGTVCASQSCSGATYTAAHLCDGAGACQTPNGATCGNYVCGPTTCKTTCISNADCATGSFCTQAGQCVGPQANGAPCQGPSQCSNGNCVDGVCCESACAGPCEACSTAKTGLTNGLCKPVLAGTDPDSECTQALSSSCGQDGMCNGARGCELYASGTVCATGFCMSGTETMAQTCDGAGNCLAATTAPCGEYVCGATACLTTCTSNSDCVTGDFCSGGTCKPPEVTGTACSAGTDCQTGYCVDGVCCENACAGACMTCNGVGTPGQCTTAVAGTDVRNDCSQDNASTCGQDGFCDGNGGCEKYGTQTQCQPAGCSNGTISAASFCSGTGTCVGGATSSCNGYACSGSGATCKSACSSDADCYNGFCTAGVCKLSNSQSPCNLAGNGNVETGTGAGWTTNGYQDSTLVIQNVATAPTLVHAGTYAMGDTNRTHDYDGPAYSLPTGVGKYNVSAWVTEANTAQPSAVQVAITCGSFADYPTLGTYGMKLDPPGTPDAGSGDHVGWTQASGIIDTTASKYVTCQPGAATPGQTNSMYVYVGQTSEVTVVDGGTEVLRPNYYMDDVVITVTDGHNLVGNPNFESGSTAGWGNNGGGTLQTTTSAFNSGMKSLELAGRSATSNGPSMTMPLGAAQYDVVFYAMHDGSVPHNLILTQQYTCKGSSAQYVSIATASNVSAGQFSKLSTTVTYPPANAPSGCLLTTAGIYVQQEQGTCGTATGNIECPNIYIDDVSITLH
jgi:hypothetical protein